MKYQENIDKNARKTESGLSGIRRYPIHKYPTQQVIIDERQVRKPQELKVGGTYREVSVRGGKKVEGRSIIKILSLENIARGYVDIEEVYPDNIVGVFKYRRELNLASRGIIPYTSGEWGDVICLVPVEKTSEKL